MWCHLWLIFILYEALFLSLLVFIVLIAFTVVPVWSPATFICAIMLSDARQISLVLPRVGFFSLSSLSRTFVSRIPNTRRSRSISSGVIVAKSHPSASLHSAVLYWSYDSPGSCTQRLNLYRSNGTFTGAIFLLSPFAGQFVNVENTSRASSPMTVSSVAT